MKVYKIFEYNLQKDIIEPIKSFKLQKTLNPDVWKNNKIDASIREDLLNIANDFYKDLDLKVDYSDIILTGSLANYNYSSYSDFDLHILLDFSKVDDNIELVKKYFDSVKAMWNIKHDIKISGFDVEIYLQDIHEPHESSGVYSLLNDEWNIEPHPSHVKIEYGAIKTKAEDYMKEYDSIQDAFDNDTDYVDIKARLKKLWDKIKQGRSAGLQSGGELSVENLVFKLLRRNGYIEKIIDLKLKAYDKHHTK